MYKNLEHCVQNNLHLFSFMTDSVDSLFGKASWNSWVVMKEPSTRKVVAPNADVVDVQRIRIGVFDERAIADGPSGSDVDCSVGPGQPEPIHRTGRHDKGHRIGNGDVSISIL